MARFLFILLAAVAAACALSSAGNLRADGEFPEIRSDAVRIVDVHETGGFAAPHVAQSSLQSFARHVSLTDGVRGRLPDFEVLYHAPNRHPGIAEPYLPLSVPDRVMIMVDGDVFIEETIPHQFAGTLGNRALEVAQLKVGKKSYLLVTSNSTVRNPYWFALFDAKGNLLYRGATRHGGYRFVEHEDGISMLDDGGEGKRITFI